MLMPLPTLLLTPLLHHRHGEPAAMAVLHARSPRMLVHAHAAPGSTHPAPFEHQKHRAAVAAAHCSFEVSEVHEQSAAALLAGKHLLRSWHQRHFVKKVSALQKVLVHMFRHGQNGGDGFDSLSELSRVRLRHV
jgi:hypothetical protein